MYEEKKSERERAKEINIIKKKMKSQTHMHA